MDNLEHIPAVMPPRALSGCVTSQTRSSPTQGTNPGGAACRANQPKGTLMQCRCLERGNYQAESIFFHEDLSLGAKSLYYTIYMFSRRGVTPTFKELTEQMLTADINRVGEYLGELVANHADGFTFAVEIGAKIPLNPESVPPTAVE